jgi:hypothetical protein
MNSEHHNLAVTLMFITWGFVVPALFVVFLYWIKCTATMKKDIQTTTIVVLHCMFLPLVVGNIIAGFVFENSVAVLGGVSILAGYLVGNTLNIEKLP